MAENFHITDVIDSISDSSSLILTPEEFTIIRALAQDSLLINEVTAPY